ncbi:MAG: TPM domain-containing protein [Oscillospiraceae bacterium]|nr:TPM domain-containing protein [Oscillospiraceae bacterium]
MKLLKNRGFAVAVLLMTVVLSSLYGLSKRPEAALPGPEPGQAADLDTSLSTAAFAPYIVDDANILSADTEKQLSFYNANWDSLGGSILAVVTEKNAGDIADAAWDWADNMELGENDALLLMDPAAADSYLLSFGTFADRFDGGESTYLAQYLYEDFQAEQYDAGVLALFEQIHAGLFHTAGGETSAAYGRVDGLIVLGDVINILILLLVLVCVFTWLDRMRYDRWNRRYGAMGVPPVVYRPILWWHRPGSAWYRMRRNPPPPPPPGRPGGRPGSIFPPPYSPNPPRPSAPKYSPPPRTGGGGFGRGGGFRNSSSGGGGFHSRGGGFRGSPRSGGGGFRGGRR